MTSTLAWGIESSGDEVEPGQEVQAFKTVRAAGLQDQLSSQSISVASGWSQEVLPSKEGAGRVVKQAVVWGQALFLEGTRL